MQRAIVLMTATLSLMTSNLALAHAHLQRSEPADQSVMAAAPKNLTVVFNEAVLITSLTIQRDAAKPQALVPLSKQAAQQLTMALPALAPGNYIVKWRALSDDQHLMSGKFTFKVGAP